MLSKSVTFLDFNFHKVMWQHILQVRWKSLRCIYWGFFYESSSDRILKIGPHLPMILTMAYFFETRCIYIHRVSKNKSTLASCSFNKHGLILIILCKQHQHTFKNYMHSTFLVSLLLLTLLAATGMTQNNVFGDSEKSQFYFSSILSDVLSPSCMHVTAFSFDQSS